MPALRKTAVVAGIVALLASTFATAQPLRPHRTQAGYSDRAYRAPSSQRRVARRAHRRVYAAPLAYDPRPYYSWSYGPYPSAADDPYNPYAHPGAAIRAQARINQNAPGLTNELAPGNIATATGGPSGGVPGFSGH